MTTTYFFQMNVPADNAASNRTDIYVNILAQWDGSFYSTGEPITIIKIVDAYYQWDFIKVKNWRKLFDEVNIIVANHFKEIAGVNNPVMERLTDAHIISDLFNEHL